MNCAYMVYAWFGSSTGLYVMLGTLFVIGLLAGWGTVNYLPERIRRILRTVVK